MADWDLSDEDVPTTTTTTTTTTTQNDTSKNQAKKKKKRKRRKKNKQSQGQSEGASPPNAQKNKKEDTWSDSDEDKQIQKQERNNNDKKKKQQQQQSKKSTAVEVVAKKKNKKKKKRKNKKRNRDLDDASNDEAEEGATRGDEEEDKQSGGKYPIWRPEQNYKYGGLQHTSWPDYIQREEMLLKVKRKQTLVDVLHAFERTHGMDSCPLNELSIDLLEVYGLNLWNSFTPIYELIGEDNHRSFMIELDSLLLDMFHCPLIENNLKFGARIGAIISLLSSHLDLYFSGGRSVQIVIFSSHRNVWKYPVHYFERELIVYYLRMFWQSEQQKKYNISYPLVFEFDSFWSDAFAAYIYEYLPVFACIARPDLSPFIWDENRYLFIYLAFYMIALDTPCVQSTEMSFAKSALYGFTIDVATDIKQYILSRFIVKRAVPLELCALVAPKVPSYLADIPSFKADLFTNLNFIECIASHVQKGNIRRLAAVYSLISMFRDDEDKSQIKIDFIKLILLNVCILEGDNPNQYRSQMLPKLIPRATKEKAKPKTPVASSWLDLDDDEEEEEEEDDDDIKEEEEEPEEEPEEAQEEEAIDVDSIINECWWIQMDGLGALLDRFMLNCTVCLSAFNDAIECESFKDCFDFRIFCYLLTRDDALSEFGCESFWSLFAIVCAEIDFNIESDLNNYGSYDSECCSYNEAVVLDAAHAFVRVDGIPAVCSALESSLSRDGLLYSTKASKISGYRVRSSFFGSYEWIRGGVIPDGIKPYVYAHRNYMIFQTFIAKYAQSLEGGKVVLRDVIVSKKQKKQQVVRKKKGHAKQKKYVHRAAKNKINVRLAAELEVRAKERRIKLEKISNLIRICDTMYSSLEQRIERLDEELCLMDASDGEAALPGLMKLHEWATQSALACNPERNMYPVVRLWQITFDIFRRYIENDCIVSVDFVRSLQRSLHLLGFFECAQRIASTFASVTGNDCLVADGECRISVGCSYARFMLQYCGPYMIRGVGSRPDARVSGFYPDEWQIKLLDIVDAGESALVVAPTSCGKTFVSYYCMKEILQNNKQKGVQKGVVVYVSPTKALTWQACADIYSKYGDVFGVLTPDYDHKPLECQVLVCVPESFEKLLMSRQRIAMAQQIKYVIFDEIHCLGRSEGGSIWERLLMLIDAPFLALSATVGAPHKLAEWLNSISPHKVHLIEHKERWSYLEKYIYLPAADTQPNLNSGELHVACYKQQIGWKTSITSIHPVAAIGLCKYGSNLLDVYDGFPPFLTFSPTDSVTFYDAMYKYCPPSKRPPPKPDVFFADKMYITKNDASAYEKLLKQELNGWLRDGHKAEVNALLSSMARDVLQRIEASAKCYSQQWVRDNFIHLVIELSSTDRLPALVFCLDRVECEQLYLKLLHDLDHLEQKCKERETISATVSDVAKQMEIEARRRAKKLEKERKKREKQREQNARQKKDADDAADPGIDEEEEREEDKRDYRFSLFDRGDEMDSDDMQFWIRRLMKKTKWPVTHPLLIGLDRGIGLHHEGLPLQYRHLVETLFRARHIKLVVSVASLAMGVNMPARSVIFAGDDASLDPLNYRQMMGRAGRRGYDNIGHVIFCGISPRKISYLMTSQLTSLNGHYPILSTTSCMRSLHHTTVLQKLLNKPFNYIGQCQHQNEQEYWRYCVDAHIQNGLLSPTKLQMDGLGELASVLHEYEPNNLLFVHILQSSLLHQLCAGYHKLPGDHQSKLKKDILLKLMLTLCYIFCAHPLPVSYKPPPNHQYASKSHLVLPTHNLPTELLQATDKYRHNFISHYYNMFYKQFCHNFHLFGQENTINYIKYYLKYGAGGQHHHLFTQDFRGRNMHHNAYVYDFYVHEDYRRIVDEASLRDGLAWRKLKRFQLLLSIINKSLNHISSLKSKQDRINQDVKEKIQQFEQSLQKLKQHKFSVYRRQQQFWMDQDGKLWKKHEIELEKDRMKLQAIGDDFVMAFQDLYKDFNHKFKNIVPIGPISNYSSVIAKQMEQQQQQAAATNTTTTTTNNTPPAEEEKTK